MRITTLNVNGVRSADKKGFRDWLARAEPDVLCLQEVRADGEGVDPAIWRPDGWEVRWNPAEKKGYAGTAVWTRRRESARFTVGNGHPRGDAEGRAVGVHLPELDVWSLYMPSGSSGPDRQAWKFEYMEHVGPWLDRLLASGRPTIVCGDFNIAHTPMDIKNAKSNEKNSGFLPEERRWLDGLVARGWRDVFRECNPTSQAYSWWSNRGNARANDVGWRIDHLWATPNVPVKAVTIDRTAGLSDHAPVTAVLDLG